MEQIKSDSMPNQFYLLQSPSDQCQVQEVLVLCHVLRLLTFLRAKFCCHSHLVCRFFKSDSLIESRLSWGWRLSAMFQISCSNKLFRICCFFVRRQFSKIFLRVRLIIPLNVKDRVDTELSQPQPLGLIDSFLSSSCFTPLHFMFFSNSTLWFWTLALREKISFDLSSISSLLFFRHSFCFSIFFVISAQKR